MDAIEQHVRELQDRVGVLEKANHRWKKGAITIGLLSLGILTMGQAPQSHTLEGEELVLHDASGATRIRLSAIDPSGPNLRFFTDNGKDIGAALSPGFLLLSNSAQLILLSAAKDGAYLDMRGGSHGVMLNATGADAPYLSMDDSEGFTTTIGTTDLVTTKTGEHHKTSAASIVLIGKGGNVLWEVP